MSKFVTYGVTEMLDNDQKFIIDSDRTGPGSITAKDAASSLLSKWAGFETFEEAVQNTISNNQEFIDRDTAIREETAELKKKIVTTFPAKEASGAVATFESEFEDAPLKSCIVQVNPVQDLHGYDHPWPAGGGVNLFDIDNINRVDGAYGLTTSIDGDTVRLSGIYEGPGYGASYRIIYHNQPIIADAKFAVFRLDTSSIRTSMRYATDSDNSIVVTISNITADADVDIRFSFMIYVGETAPTVYTPYSNICPISGFTGVKVTRCRKNLFDPSVLLVQPDMYSVNDDWSITVMRSNSSAWDFLPEIILPPGTYTISRDINVGNTSVRDITVNNGIVFMGDGTAAYSSTFKVVEGHVVKIRLCSGAQTYPVTINIQIEKGSTATDYEPYQGNTYPITFPSEAGTVYGAYVDVTGGELVVDRAIFTVDGSNDLAVVQSDTYTAVRLIDYQHYRGEKNVVFDACDKFVCSKPNEEGLYKVWNNNLGTRMWFGLPPEITTVDEAKAWFAENPTQIVAKVVEESIHYHVYPLTPTEIKTLLGQNNIWSNTGDTAVEYLMSDVGWYVEKKLRAFQSILAGVEDSTSASKNYSTDSYLIFNDDIYRVTKTITAGETIEDGVNVTKTTVAEQLMALAQV